MRSNTALAVSLTFALVFGSAIFALGQAAEAAEDEQIVSVPEYAMEQVVRRILIWSFKPRNAPKVIYLSGKHVERAWLPLIRNIEFRLLTDEQIDQRPEGVYFFTQPDFSDDEYNLCFNFGDPECNYSGSYWHFHLSDQKVKLWQNGTCGTICTHSTRP